MKGVADQVQAGDIADDGLNPRYAGSVADRVLRQGRGPAADEGDFGRRQLPKNPRQAAASEAEHRFVRLVHYRRGGLASEESAQQDAAFRGAMGKFLVDKGAGEEFGLGVRCGRFMALSNEK